MRLFELLAAAGAGGGWTPLELGGDLDLWLDAADSGTITLNSGNVSQWDDKSGNGRHVAQATAAKQPAYSATGFGGLPCIDFDGSDDFLKNASYQPTGAFTIFIVFRQIESVGSLVLVNRAGAALFEIIPNTASSFLFDTTTGAAEKTVTHIGTDRILGLQYDGAGTATTDFTARVNGSSLAIISGGALGYSGAETGFSLGGRPVQNVFYFQHLLAEVIYLESDADAADVEKIEGYLAHKWGLEASLPGGHPYKSAAP